MRVHFICWFQKLHTIIQHVGTLQELFEFESKNKENLKNVNIIKNMNVYITFSLNERMLSH